MVSWLLKNFIGSNTPVPDACAKIFGINGTAIDTAAGEIALNRESYTISEKHCKLAIVEIALIACGELIMAEQQNSPNRKAYFDCAFRRINELKNLPSVEVTDLDFEIFFDLVDMADNAQTELLFKIFLQFSLDEKNKQKYQEKIDKVREILIQKLNSNSALQFLAMQILYRANSKPDREAKEVFAAAKKYVADFLISPDADAMLNAAKILSKQGATKSQAIDAYKFAIIAATSNIDDSDEYWLTKYNSTIGEIHEQLFNLLDNSLLKETVEYKNCKSVYISTSPLLYLKDQKSW